MTSEDYTYLSSTMIRDYIFCPVIFYYKYVRNIWEPETFLMKEGKEKYEEYRDKGKYRVTVLGQRKVKPDKILYSQEVYSRSLNIYGIVDAIYWIGNKAYIVEIKDSGLKKPPPDHIYQAVAYALMAEETFNTTVYKIQIYYRISDTWIERRVTAGLRRYVKKIVHEIKRILDGKYIPEPKKIKACKSCWYRGICY